MKSCAICFILVAAAGLVLQSSPARAGKPPNRSGFYIGFGLGFGSANWTEGSDLDGSSEDSGGGAVNFRLGGAIRQNVIMGMELSTWARNEDNATLTFQAATAAVTYFPGNVGAYLRGGFGFGSSSFEVDVDVEGSRVNISKTDSGWVILGAGGYEWRLSNKFAMGPQIEVVYLGLAGELIDTASLINGTLQFNWYW
jgi:hypothetical protein